MPAVEPQWAPLGEWVAQIVPWQGPGGSRDLGRGGFTMRKNERLSNGGLFSVTGWYWKRRMGHFRAYVTHLGRTVVLRFEDRTVVLSPGDPAGFVAALGAPGNRAPSGGTDAIPGLAEEVC